MEDRDLLSDGEKKVADLLARGYSIKEICKELNLSINTVKSRLDDIYIKLNFKYEDHPGVLLVNWVWDLKRNNKWI